MARKPNIAYDAKKLDEAIKAIDGERYNQTNISKFIMRKGSAYYSQSMGKQMISEDALDNICKFYKLNKKEFVLKEAPAPVKPKVAPPAPAASSTVDLDGILAGFEVLAAKLDEFMKTLSEINKVLQAIESHQKSTNYNLEQMTDKLITIKKSNEEMSRLLQQRESRYSGKNNVKRIG